MEEVRQKVALMLANFAMYLANDTGKENDEHDKEISKFVFYIQSLRKSDMEAVEEMIGEDEPLDKDKNKFAISLNIEKAGENFLRSELRSKLKEYREKNSLI